MSIEKIEAVRLAIEKAEKLQSNMDATSWNVPALSSLRLRHLMNNLGAISTNYLECGVHKGGLFCSTIRNNHNLEFAYYIDSFESDNIPGAEESAQEQFDENVIDCISDGSELTVMGYVSDTFHIDVDHMPQGFDLYLYDADHSYECQRKAMTFFLDNMADVFVVCVDDYDWKEVWTATQDGLKDAGVEILFEWTAKGNDHDNDGYWNGFYVALCKKK